MVLIGLILVAFVIPSLKVSQNFHLPQIEQVFERLNIPEEETEQEHDLQKMEQVTTTTLHTQLEKERSDFTILTLGNLGFLYLGGALLLLLRYIFSIACIYRLIRNSEKKCWKGKSDWWSISKMWHRLVGDTILCYPGRTWRSMAKKL